MLRAAVLTLALVLAPAVFASSASVTPVERGSGERIPFKQSEDSVSGIALRVVGSLVLVVFIGIGAVYLLKRYLPMPYRSISGSNRLKIIEALRLTPNVTLFLVEIDGRQLVLGQAGNSIQTLYEDKKVPTAVSDDR